MKHLGDPRHPCDDIERSRSMINTIEKEALLRAEQGDTTTADVESGIEELKQETIELLGMTCGRLCPKLGRCILDSFGSDDPLLRLRPGQYTKDERLEMDAKRHLDMLTMLTKMGMGMM